eukprot:1153074-Pelagomonas_calceolata.AAC.2
MSSCFSLLLLPYPPAWARVADSGAAVLAGAVVDVDDDGAAAIAAPAAAGGALPAAFAAWGGLLLAGAPSKTGVGAADANRVDACAAAAAAAAADDDDDDKDGAGWRSYGAEAFGLGPSYCSSFVLQCCPEALEMKCGDGCRGGP